MTDEQENPASDTAAQALQRLSPRERQQLLLLVQSLREDPLDEHEATFLRLDLHRKCKTWGVSQEAVMTCYDEAKAAGKL